MTERTARATWKGDLKEGRGTFRAMSDDGIQGEVTFDSRFKEGTGSNPEELIGAAEASCFSMALSGELADAGFNPRNIETKARVNLGSNKAGDPEIGRIILDVKGTVDGIDKTQFHEMARRAAKNSPVARALGGVEIQLGDIQVN